MLDREEYIEQAHFFTMLAERNQTGTSTQDLLGMVREEILSTTKLPMAIDYLTGELKLLGQFHTAMARLSHYFTPFQTFVVGEAERDMGRFDMLLALTILAREAKYRAEGATAQGIFLYEFESLARNRLGYDHGLAAVAGDPIFDVAWREWIMLVRHQVGLVDFADLIYVRSEHYFRRQMAVGELDEETADERASRRQPARRVVRRGGRADCVGQPRQGSTAIVRRAASAFGLSRGAASGQARRIATTVAAIGASHGASRSADETGGGRAERRHRHHPLLHAAGRRHAGEKTRRLAGNGPILTARNACGSFICVVLAAAALRWYIEWSLADWVSVYDALFEPSLVAAQQACRESRAQIGPCVNRADRASGPVS